MQESVLAGASVLFGKRLPVGPDVPPQWLTRRRAMPRNDALGRTIGQAAGVRRHCVLGTASFCWAVLGVLMLALSGCGGTSVASSPTEVVKDLFAAYQANDCNRVFALQTKALDSGEGGKAAVCRVTVQLAARYRGNTFRVDRVDRHDNRADVFATRTNPDGTTRS